MAWAGWFSIGDGADEVEIINVARTEAYAAAVGLRWFTPGYRSDLLAAILGEDPYVSVASDPAPWYDPNVPASKEFLGFYPTEVSGIEDSSRSADVVESTLVGGIPGRLHFGTKTPVFNGVLLATSIRGAEYGFQWLDRATAMWPCILGRPNFTGYTLHYLNVDPSSEPGCGAWAGDPPASDAGLPVLRDFARSLRKFKVTSGPRPLAKEEMSDGGAMWNVQMTGTAGSPWQFGAPRLILDNMDDSGDPYAAGITPGVYDVTGEVIVDAACPEPVWAPLFDPNCPPVTTPPEVPLITNVCVDLPDNWWRRRAQIPKAYIPLFGDAVPVVSITATDTDVELLRMRIWPDVSDTGIPEDCTFIGDYVISYIPADHVLVFDGVAEAVYVVDPTTGDQQRADSLVSASDGGPFEWPRLTCGLGYIVTFDLVDDTTPVPSVDLSLVWAY